MRGRTVERSSVFLRGNQTVFAHLAQDVVGAVIGDIGSVAALGIAGVEVAAGIVVVGASCHTGEHGAFAQRQLAELLAKIAVGCDLDTIIVAAHKNGVEIAFKNLVLGIAGFKLHGEIGFLKLALIALLAGEHGHLDELLGDSGTALRGASGEVGNQRADDSLDVHAVVLIKACVLNSDKGILEHFGNLIDGDHDAVLGTLVVGDQVAVAVVNKRGLVLRIERGKVERRCGVDVGLGDADQRAGERQTCAQDQQDGQADGRHCDAEQEVGIFCAGLEDGVHGSAALCLLLAFFLGNHRRGHAGSDSRGCLCFLCCGHVNQRFIVSRCLRALLRWEHGRVVLWHFSGLIIVHGHGVPPYEG